MAKYTRVNERTKQNLIDAFWQIYCVKRIEKISIKEITERAGYNRSTFYEYFSDVYDCLDAIETSLLPNIEELPSIVFTSSTKQSPFESFIKLYAASHEYYSVLLGDHGDPAFAGKMKNGIKNVILSHIDLENEDITTIDYTLKYVLSAIIGTLTYWFKSDENITQEKLLSLLNSLMDCETIVALTKKIIIE